MLGRFPAGQRYGKGCSLARPAFNIYPATVFLNYLIANAQVQAGAIIFCSKEGRARLQLFFAGHAFSVIGYFQEHFFLYLVKSGTDDYPGIC